MQFDSIRFLEDHNIPFIEHHGTVTERYVGLETCVFCQAKAYGSRIYGAIGKRISSYSCWRCGIHPFTDFLKLVLNTSDYSKIKAIYKEYGGDSVSDYYRRSSDTEIERPRTIELPGTTEMIPQARDYLIYRGFNPEYLWQKYKLQATTHHKDYGYRIIYPTILDGRVVSFTSRDWTDKQEAKGKAARLSDEVIPHKDIFFGMDFVKGNNVLVVEGEMDQMRVGDGSIASYGTKITLPQVQLLARRYDNIFIGFDGGEAEALTLAESVATTLKSVGKHCEVIEFEDGDPDSLFRDNLEDLAYLKKDLGLQ